MLTREAAGIRPMFKKNRRLVLAVASGCTLVELFSILLPFLVGHMIWKHLPLAFIFSTISHFIRIVGCYHLAILFKYLYSIFCESYVSTG